MKTVLILLISLTIFINLGLKKCNDSSFFLKEAKNVEFLISDNNDTIPFKLNYYQDSIVKDYHSGIDFHVVSIDFKERFYFGLGMRNDTIFQGYFYNEEFDMIEPLASFNKHENIKFNVLGDFLLFNKIIKIQSYECNNNRIVSFTFETTLNFADAPGGPPENRIKKFSLSVEKGLYNFEVINRKGVVYRQIP